MGGVKVTTDLALKLIERIENFAGVIDASLDWQFMIEVLSTARRIRPDFQLLTGIEYMISAGAIGASGMFSSLAGIAPTAVQRLWELCGKEHYAEARPVQEALAALRQAVKPTGVAGLKGGLRAMGRECGQPRPPLDPLSDRRSEGSCRKDRRDCGSARSATGLVVNISSSVMMKNSMQRHTSAESRRRSRRERKAHPEQPSGLRSGAATGYAIISFNPSMA